MAKARTKLPNGKKPSYKDLEESFLTVFEKLIKANDEVSRLTKLNAELRYNIEKDKPCRTD